MIYSFIIPHYNLPRLLRRCVDSIPKRDDVEIIVVDDCSDNRYRSDIYTIRDSYSNLRLIELNENKGGGYARNQGLKYATGKWVIFADSDDFFNYCINQILDEYADAPEDLIFFKTNSVDCETYENANRTILSSNSYIDLWFHNPNEAEDKLRYLHGVPVSKMIKRTLIENHKLKFDTTRIHNDTTFTYLSGHHATKIAADRRCLYCATTRIGSVSKQKGIQHQLTTIDILGRGVVFFHKIGKRYFEDYLAANLYLLLKAKDYVNFNIAIKRLSDIGLSQIETNVLLAHEMGKYSPKSLINCILHAPSVKFFVVGIRTLFYYSLPYHIIKSKINKAK